MAAMVLCIIPPFIIFGLPLLVLFLVTAAAGFVGKSETKFISREEISKEK
jgi:hypothetical protein